MKPGLSSPPVWRIVLAFLVAPMFAAVLLACLSPLWAGLPNWADRVARTTQMYAVGYAYPATVLLGMPAFMIFRRGAGSWLLKSLGVGAAIAALPLLLLGAASNPDYAFSGGHVTHVNGVRNLDGWIDLGKLVGFVAVSGALARFVFWIVAAAG